MRPNVEGVSIQALRKACALAGSSVKGLIVLTCSSRLSWATICAPPETGGALEKSV